MHYGGSKDAWIRVDLESENRSVRVAAMIGFMDHAAIAG
jgi:hypothetical protein